LFNEGTAKELWVRFDNHHYGPTLEEIEYLSAVGQIIRVKEV
jgi:hypothetical protein